MKKTTLTSLCFRRYTLYQSMLRWAAPRIAKSECFDLPLQRCSLRRHFQIAFLRLERGPCRIVCGWPVARGAVHVCFCRRIYAVLEGSLVLDLRVDFLILSGPAF